MLVDSNTMVIIAQMKAMMEGLTLSISVLNSMTVKPVKLLRHTLSIPDVMAGGRLFLCVCVSVLQFETDNIHDRSV